MNRLGSEGTRKDTEDTTMIVQIEEVMCVIRSLPFVTKLSPVGDLLPNSMLWKETRTTSLSVQVSSRYPTIFLVLNRGL